MRDEDAVSPVIGVILLVSITVVLGALVFMLASQFGEQEDDDPRLVMVFDDLGAAEGGILTVSEVLNGPIDVADVVLGGSAHDAAPCTWSRASGSLQAGDQLTCTEAGTITLTEAKRKILLHANSFR